MSQPTLSLADAEEMCQVRYDSRQDAFAAGRRLRAGGWRVVELRRPIPHPDGLVTVAAVYHPDSHESPGDLLVVADAPAFPRQRRHEPGE